MRTLDREGVDGFEALGGGRSDEQHEGDEGSDGHGGSPYEARTSRVNQEVAPGRAECYEEAVRGYYAATRAAFPDQRNVVHAIHHADDAVIVEFDLLGTHRGPLRGIPPTGRAFTCRMVALFLFDGELIVCERVYFDAATILRQLGIGP